MIGFPGFSGPNAQWAKDMLREREEELCAEYPHHFKLSECAHWPDPFKLIHQQRNGETSEVDTWFDETGVAEDAWDATGDYIGFKNPNDAFAFKMRWL